jgi:ribosomal-protein-alanine N-acetyltransferase
VRHRTFATGDLPQVYDLACQSLSENYNPTLFVDLHAYWPEALQVIEEDGAVRGFVFGVAMSRSEARILMLAVDERYRHRGYGTLLLNGFKVECAKRGIINVVLEVRVSNRPAIQFYQHRGFQVVGTIPRYYTNGDDAYRMQTWL